MEVVDDVLAILGIIDAHLEEEEKGNEDKEKRRKRRVGLGRGGRRSGEMEEKKKKRKRKRRIERRRVERRRVGRRRKKREEEDLKGRFPRVDVGDALLQFGNPWNSRSANFYKKPLLHHTHIHHNNINTNICIHKCEYNPDIDNIPSKGEMKEEWRGEEGREEEGRGEARRGEERRGKERRGEGKEEGGRSIWAMHSKTN